MKKLREMVPIMVSHGNKFSRYPDDNDFADAARLLEQAAQRIELALARIAELEEAVETARADGWEAGYEAAKEEN